MIGFMRMFVITVGAFILAMGALEKYVGAGTLETILWRFPGYETIRDNPGPAGMIGAVLIIVAFIFPTGAVGINDKR